MTASFRLANLKRVYTNKEPVIVRVATSAKTPPRQKQLIYGCLNNLCRISALLYGELSAAPGNYELLEEAAELDNSLVKLRGYVGSQIPTRMQHIA